MRRGYLRTFGQSALAIAALAASVAGCSKQSGDAQQAAKPADNGQPAGNETAGDSSTDSASKAPSRFIYETGRPQPTAEQVAANNAWAEQRAHAAQEGQVTQLALDIRAQQEAENFTAAAESINKLITAETNLHGADSSEVQAARNRGVENRWLASLTASQHLRLADASKLELKAEVDGRQGQIKEALTAAQQAATIYRDLGGEQTVEYGKMMLFMADKFMLLNDFNTAQRAFQIGLETLQRTSGVKSPLYGRGLMSMSSMYISHGDFVEAAAVLAEACKLFSAAGEDDGSYAYALMTMGVVYKEVGDYKRAMDVIQQAMTVAEPQGVQGKGIQAECLQHLAGAHFRMKDYGEAERLQIKGMEVMQEAFGETPLMIGCRCRLARIYIKSGQLDQAESILKAAGADETATFGDDSPLASYGAQYLAELYVARHKYAQAEPLLAKVLAIREKNKLPTHPAIAEVLETYVAALNGLGRTADADKLERRRQTIETNLVAVRDQLAHQTATVAARPTERK